MVLVELILCLFYEVRIMYVHTVNSDTDSELYQN